MAGDLSIDYSERAGFLTGRSAALADWAFRRENAGFNKLCARLYQRNWARAYRVRNAERVRARLRAWRAANRDRINAQDRARRAKRRTPKRCVCVECGRVQLRPRVAHYCSAACRGRKIWAARAKARNRGIRTMDLRARIVGALASQPMRLRELAEAAGVKRGSAATVLTALVRSGVVSRRTGLYSVEVTRG